MSQLDLFESSSPPVARRPATERRVCVAFRRGAVVWNLVFIEQWGGGYWPMLTRYRWTGDGWREGAHILAGVSTREQCLAMAQRWAMRRGGIVGCGVKDWQSMCLAASLEGGEA